MIFMWKTSKGTTLITTIPFLAIGIGLLYLEFTASPDAITDDGLLSPEFLLHDRWIFHYRPSCNYSRDTSILQKKQR